jgi:hypothetical protein
MDLIRSMITEIKVPRECADGVDLVLADDPRLLILAPPAVAT